MRTQRKASKTLTAYDELTWLAPESPAVLIEIQPQRILGGMFRQRQDDLTSIAALRYRQNLDRLARQRDFMLLD